MIAVQRALIHDVLCLLLLVFNDDFVYSFPLLFR